MGFTTQELTYESAWPEGGSHQNNRSPPLGRSHSTHDLFDFGKQKEIDVRDSERNNKEKSFKP